MVNVTRLTAEYPQSPIFAMRLSKAVQALDISARTGIKPDEVKRFNPALGVRVPAQANLYLPFYVQAVRTRRLVLASSTDGGICGGAQRLPAYRRWDRTVARGLL